IISFVLRCAKASPAMLTMARAVTARIKARMWGLPCKVFADCLRRVVTHPRGWDARSVWQSWLGRKCQADIKSIADRYGATHASTNTHGAPKHARQHEIPLGSRPTSPPRARCAHGPQLLAACGQALRPASARPPRSSATLRAEA